VNWTVVPVLLPFATAVLLLLWRGASVGRRVAVAISAAAQLVIALGLTGYTGLNEVRLVVGAGGWSPPLGIVLVIDPLTAIMLSLSTLMALGCLLFSFAEMPTRLEHPLRLPLWQFLVAGINLSFCTGDLFNLFVAFEIMLIASYALLTLEADDWDVRQAFPYLAINLVGSALFLVGVSLVYALFGTLNMADIAVRSAAMAGDPRIPVVVVVLMLVFSIKAGVFPLYYWLPNSYPILAAPLAAFYAGMLTKVGIYVLLRLFATVVPHDLELPHDLLAWLAGFTMIFGVIGAISRNFIRGILSWHILSQVGYMVLAIGFFTPVAIGACVFYIVHHIVVKGTLFLIGGTAAVLMKGTDNLERMGGLWKATPVLGVCFLFQALSLAGVPPFSGFWGKYLIFVEGVRLESWVLVGAALVAGILTLYSMLKIWNGAFWPKAPEGALNPPDKRWVPMTWVIGGLTAVSLCIGLGAGWFMDFAITAARMAMDQQGFAADVLGYLGKGGVN
jgi:multicomponent Na+:H+ antiporter subunit D